MRISKRTIQALGKIITGDGGMSPYRSGPQLVEFFNEHGGNALYGDGFPSRWKFAEDELQKLNNSPRIKRIIEDALDPRHYLEAEFDISSVVDHFNTYLAYDGYSVVRDGLYYRVRPTGQQFAHTPNLEETIAAQPGSHAFILEQIDKCREKFAANDYDGAITNARSMVEAVFEETLKKAGEQVPDHKGDMHKLYQAIKKRLNLNPNQKDLDETLKQTLSGLNSIVTGIAGISNKMGDRHARRYKPEKHHALLVINTAHALCEFVVSSLEYQTNSQKGVNND